VRGRARRALLKREPAREGVGGDQREPPTRLGRREVRLLCGAGLQAATSFWRLGEASTATSRERSAADGRRSLLIVYKQQVLLNSSAMSSFRLLTAQHRSKTF